MCKTVSQHEKWTPLWIRLLWKCLKLKDCLGTTECLRAVSPAFYCIKIARSSIWTKAPMAP